MQNFFELMQNLQEIKKMVEHSGKTPEQFLESLVSSGKYSQTQIDQAKNMAAMLQNILKGGSKMSDLSAGDILAMQKGSEGFLEGNGIIILILFFLMFGGGFGFGGDNASMQGAMTRAEMQDGFNNQNTVNTLNNIAIGMNNGFNSLNLGMNNGFNGVQSSIANLGFNMQQCCCDIKTQIGIQGDLTRQLITQNTMQDLRDKLQDKDRELNSAIFAASQLTQTRTLEDFILANK